MSNSKKTRNYQRQAESARQVAGPRTAIKYDGHTYKIPHQDDWSIETLDLLYDAEANPLNAIGVLRELLGNQWDSFKTRHPNAKTHISGFMDAVQKAYEKVGDSPN
jgi:hypothetical protein